MKIGQFTDTFLPITDGVGRVVYSYANALSKNGHEVTVSAPMYDTGYRGGYLFELVDFRSFTLPFAKQYKTGFPIFDANYKSRMNMIPLDIVHAHSPFRAGQEALRISKKQGIPLVTTFHSKYYDDFLKVTKSKLLSKMGIKIILSFYNKCDSVWAVSKSSAETLRSYGYKGNIIVMPNGVSKREIKTSNIEYAKKTFNIPNKPVFLFVGQISLKKNIHLIVKACALLKAQNIDFLTLLVGQGHDTKIINNLIVNLGLSDNIKFLGHISNMDLLDGLYSVANIFVFPSIYDNAPMVVRESAVMKTPAILIKNSSSAEIVTDNYNGLLCDNTPESLFEKLKYVVENENIINQIGENAYNTIPIDWMEIVDDVVNNYKNIIEEYKSK
ncbi:MAG: glycosyltransferase family 4 protein [Christensenellaceae bacterium]|nr:glycosyltransferase family 4 protein [Christensenellaceae bacterium]